MPDKKKARPKLGDRVEYTRGVITLEGTIIAVSENGVYYKVKSDGGRHFKIGLSRIVRVLKPRSEHLNMHKG